MNYLETPVVILAGGLGTRLREETEYKPKPMVEIGSYPIIWHIMKTFSFHGFNNFIICAGYKKDIIQDYFLNYKARNSIFTVSLNDSEKIKYWESKKIEPWKVTVVDTGDYTNTGGRIWKLQDVIKSERFFCTYGDGVSDIDISKLYKFHTNNSVVATVSAVKQRSRFGILRISGKSEVEEFSEKPIGETWINAGYFLFENKIFEYLSEDSILEKEPLEKLVLDKNLNAFQHDGFWQPMDTYREFKELNELWEKGKAPWKKWN